MCRLQQCNLQLAPVQWGHNCAPISQPMPRHLDTHICAEGTSHLEAGLHLPLRAPLSARFGQHSSPVRVLEGHPASHRLEGSLNSMSRCGQPLWHQLLPPSARMHMWHPSNRDQQGAKGPKWRGHDSSGQRRAPRGVIPWHHKQVVLEASAPELEFRNSTPIPHAHAHMRHVRKSKRDNLRGCGWSLGLKQGPEQLHHRTSDKGLGVHWHVRAHPIPAWQ